MIKKEEEEERERERKNNKISVICFSETLQIKVLLDLF
jgi:hypothetical protein